MRVLHQRWSFEDSRSNTNDLLERNGIVARWKAQEHRRSDAQQRGVVSDNCGGKVVWTKSPPSTSVTLRQFLHEFEVGIRNVVKASATLERRPPMRGKLSVIGSAQEPMKSSLPRPSIGGNHEACGAHVAHLWGDDVSGTSKGVDEARARTILTGGRGSPAALTSKGSEYQAEGIFMLGQASRRR